MTAESPELRALTSFLDRSVDGAVVVDQELRIRYCNEAYARIVGRRRQELLAERPHCGHTLPLEICRDGCAVRTCTRLNRPIRMDEIRASAADGERTMIVTAMPLLDDAGGSLGAIEVYRDVTAEARTQAHYKVLLERARTEHERLEEEVRTRTDALRQAQAQLVHQEKMSSLGRLVAGVTHELNNPLHFVSGNLSFLERYATVLLEVIDAYQSGGRDAGRQAADERDLAHIAQDLPKLLKSVRNGAERASRIVRSLRTFSHPGRDRAEPADLEKCLRSSLEIVEPMLKGRVEVDVRMDGLPPVVCNSSQLGQVFLNLLTNAADAIEGPGHIRVSGSVDGEFVEVRLADDGVGIAPADLQRLFEPFFTTKPVGSGTGLGLSISYAIVRDHGGSIQASSEPGRGTTFMVRLPIRGGGPAASA